MEKFTSEIFDVSTYLMMVEGDRKTRYVQFEVI